MGKNFYTLRFNIMVFTLKKIIVFVVIVYAFSFFMIACKQNEINEEQQQNEIQETEQRSIEESKPDSMKMLTKAIYDNNLDGVKAIIAADKSLIGKLNEFELTPLTSACRVANLEIVKYLISLGADVNKGCGYKNSVTPIQSSVKSHEIVNLLIEHGADVNSGGPAPLYLAALKGYYKSVVLLVENGAEINTSDHGSPPLRAAAAQLHVDIVRYLLSKGADVTYNEKSGLDQGTVLDMAINENDTSLNASPEKRKDYVKAKEEIIKMLREAGAKTASELEN